MTFGAKVKHIRKNILRLTQDQLSESLGLTQAAINSIENGINKNGSFNFLKKLVTVHSVNPMYFFQMQANRQY